MKVASILGPLEIGVHYWRYVQASRLDRAQPPFFNPDRPHNIGDWFLTKIIDRILDYDDLVLVKKDAEDHDWEYVNEQCDFLVLRGGNYIQSDWLSREIGLDVIRKIKIPIIIFGAGLQTSFAEKIDFGPEEIEILRYIHDSCGFSAVRGERTAEALQNIGINNAVVTGCPTIFWSRKPALQVRRPADRSAGFTYRDGLYSSDPALYRAQFDALEVARDKFGTVKVLLQGEEVALQNYFQARRWNAEYLARLTPVPEHEHLLTLDKQPLDLPALRDQIHARYDQHSRPQFIDWFLNNTFFSWDIADYLDEYMSQGMMLGCRLHSNLLALANETPTYYLTYDQRTQELVDLFRIPHSRLVDFSADIDLLEQDWTPFQTQYEHYYKQMVGFLEGNGLSHKLIRPDAVPDDHSREPVRITSASRSSWLDGRDTKSDAYPIESQEFAGRVRATVQQFLPRGATIVVISRGDDDLVRFSGRVAWHFPQSTEGWYAGFHPSDSAEAIEHLESLREKGGEYLLIPAPSYWWLDYYPDFKNHLDGHYPRAVLGENLGVLYALNRLPESPTGGTVVDFVETGESVPQPVFGS